MVDSLSSSTVVGAFCHEDVWNVLLGVSVDDWEPGALNLNHDAMPWKKRMPRGVKINLISDWLVAFHRARFCQTVAKTCSSNLHIDWHLVTRERRSVVRILIDDLDYPIRISSRS